MVLNFELVILMMKYGETFKKNSRKGARIMAFLKRNFFFRSPFKKGFWDQSRSHQSWAAGKYSNLEMEPESWHFQKGTFF